jgi:hypothetical protein
VFTARYELYVPPGLTFTNATFCPHSVFMCFVWISEQTAIISVYSVNWLVFITETECVYCAVRSESINNTDFHWFNPPALSAVSSCSMIPAVCAECLLKSVLPSLCTHEETWESLIEFLSNFVLKTFYWCGPKVTCAPNTTAHTFLHASQD